MIAVSIASCQDGTSKRSGNSRKVFTHAMRMLSSQPLPLQRRTERGALDQRTNNSSKQQNGHVIDDAHCSQTTPLEVVRVEGR
jgi:hypothetical protein